MNEVPAFISNTADDMHCVNAVFRMIAIHLLNKDFTWEEIDTLTKAIPGKATWTFIGETEFVKMGLKVKNIEPIDYEELHKQGITYLKEIMGRYAYNYTENRSNLVSVIQYIPEFIERVEHETRRASVEEVIGYLREGKLVAAEVNSNLLNNKPGFNLHFVLLFDFDGEHIILHDPGLPPIESRKVTPTEFEACFNYEGANGEIAVFSK
ncbi:MAG TPA: hypothetical protein VMU27_01630 [Candidatus Paceibacterota bacterium]|nr:hypothetical protein [Candidatus Paceibacterota bacterium]